jgi:hypothetical protein
VGPIVVLGVGAAALVTSLGFFLARNNAITRLEAMCDPVDHIQCPDTPPVNEALGQARTWTTATNITFIGGLIVVAGGAAWLAVNALSHPRHELARVRNARTFQFAALPSGAWMGFGGAL